MGRRTFDKSSFALISSNNSYYLLPCPPRFKLLLNEIFNTWSRDACTTPTPGRACMHDVTQKLEGDHIRYFFPCKIFPKRDFDTFLALFQDRFWILIPRMKIMQSTKTETKKDKWESLEMETKYFWDRFLYFLWYLFFYTRKKVDKIRDCPASFNVT